MSVKNHKIKLVRQKLFSKLTFSNEFFKEIEPTNILY